jgi:sugar/nucleoside kinase (ribokinase family)
MPHSKFDPKDQLENLIVKRKFQVLGIGNPIVDMIKTVDDEDLVEMGLEKGSMTLMSLDQSEELRTGILEDAELVAGGSAANTMVCLSQLGISAAFIGKTGQDYLGEFFSNDIKKAGVTYLGPTANSRVLNTGFCGVFITKDAERTMATYLGVSASLDETDIEAENLQNAAILYLEGYLLDSPPAAAAVFSSANQAKSLGNVVALSLSDPFVVERHKDKISELAEKQLIDILFSNNFEATALARQNGIYHAGRELNKMFPLVIITKGKDGSSIFCGGDPIDVACEDVARVIDTTGAGDAYAAGFLAGLVKGFDLSLCGRLGSRVSGEVIQHFGSRPQIDISKMIDTLENER